MSAKTSPGCVRVGARMAVLLDGGLAPLAAALDRGHLEACAECRGERARHLRLLASVRALSRSNAPDAELVERAVLERLAGLRIRPQRSLAPALLGATAAAVLLALLLAGGSSPAPSSPDLAGLGGFLDRLPSWSEVARGLRGLPQRLPWNRA